MPYLQYLLSLKIMKKKIKLDCQKCNDVSVLSSLSLVITDSYFSFHVMLQFNSLPSIKTQNNIFMTTLITRQHIHYDMHMTGRTLKQLKSSPSWH